MRALQVLVAVMAAWGAFSSFALDVKTDYEYDDLYRLKRVTCWADVNEKGYRVLYTTTYTYDKNGNRVGMEKVPTNPIIDEIVELERGDGFVRFEIKGLGFQRGMTITVKLPDGTTATGVVTKLTPSGAEVTFTDWPDGDTEFVLENPDGKATSSPFDLPEHILTVIIVGNGSVDQDPLPPYYLNPEVTLTATPDAGWEFVEWTGDLVSTNPTDTIRVNSNKTVTAHFERLKGTVTVEVTPDTSSWTITDGDGIDHTGTGDTTIPNVPTGQVSITYDALAGYERPSDETKQLNEGQTATFTGTYAPATITGTRSFSPERYASPGTMDVSILVEDSGIEALTQLRIEETLPATWSFDSMVSDPPGTQPTQGDTGTLVFEWTSIPTLPVTLTYRVTVPAGQTGEKVFDGTLKYARSGPQENVEIGGVIGIQRNTPPEAQNPTVTPALPRTDDDLQVGYTYSDADDHLKSDVNYRWYKDTVLQGGLTGQTAASSNTTKGDSWYSEVRVHDGIEWGDWTASNPVIVDNTPPVAVNDPPAGTPYDVNEGDTLTVTAPGVLGNDTDADNDSLTAVIENGPSRASSFSLNTDGSFTYTHDGSETTQDSFTYHAHDGTASSDQSATVTITVNPVNDQPVITGQSPLTTLEETSLTITLADLTVVDPDNIYPNDFTLSVQDGANYTRIGATITPVTDYNGPLTVPVTVHDGTDPSPPFNLVVSVNPVNDAPSFTKGPDQSVTEDAGAQNVPSWATNISAGPADESGQALTFNITGNTNSGLFAAGPGVDATGALTYTPADDANGSADITLELQDDGGTANGGQDTSTPETFTITVNAVNDAPSFTKGPDQNVDEDAGPQSVPNWATNISAGPGESGQTPTFNVTDNTNQALFSTQPAVDAVTGTLTYTPAADANGSADITLELQDDGGTANGGQDTSPPQSFTITVNTVNDAPSFTKGPDQNVTEDAGAQNVPSWATNVSAGPADESGQALTFNVTGNTNPGLFAAGPAVDATAALTYTPAADANGSATVTLALQDDGGVANGGQDTSPPQSFTITLAAVNDAPSFAKGPDQNVTEDAGAQTVPNWATNISPGPADEAGQTLTFNVTGNSNPGLFAAGPAVDATGTLTYTPAADANGSADITLELQDDGGTANGGQDTSTPDTFTITVNAVNDAPSFTKGPDQNVNEDAGAQNVPSWATNVSAGPADESGQALTFNVTGNTNPGLFAAGPAVDATGALTYTPAADANGSATVTLALQDDGGTANGGQDTSPPQSFTITVNAVNDAPSFTKGPDQNVNEDAGAQTVPNWATNISPGPADESGQTLAFNVTGNTNPGLFAAGPTVDAAGTLTYTPAADANGSADITLELQDDGGTANGGQDTSTPDTFTITVNAVNDAPVAVDDPPTGTSYEVNEGDTLTVTAPGVLGNDEDKEDDPLTAVLENSPSNASDFNLNADGSFTYTHNDGETTEDSFTYYAHDGTVPSEQAATVTITVTPVDDVLVPNVVGDPMEDARRTLEDAGLQVGTVDEAASLTVARDHIISQAPVADEWVLRGSAVDLVVSLGAPQTFHVDITNDTGVEDGTFANPYNTIAEAIAQTVGGRGDEIVVRPGTYGEVIALTSATTLIGADGSYHTILIAPSKAAGDLVALAEECVVRGLTLVGSNSTATVHVPESARAEVTNCVLHDGQVGLQADAAARVTLSNNTFYGNVVGFSAGTNVVIEMLENSVFVSNGTAVSAVADGVVVGDVDYNAFYDNTTNYDWAIAPTNDVHDDPLFVDPDDLNLHLQWDSPCRDAGDPASEFNDKDGSPNDMGADGGPEGVQDTLAPSPVADVSPTSGPASLAVEFDGTGSSDEWGIASYSWDIDSIDGIQPDLSGPVPTHTYETPGTYVATLTVEDNSGHTGDATTVPIAVGNNLPTASAAADPNAGPAPLPVQFQGNGQDPDGGPVTFAWDFGNGVGTSSQQNPAYTYPAGTALGSYEAQLVVTDDEGASTPASAYVTITKGPVAAAGIIEPGVGGTCQVDDPGSPLNGYTLTIPPGALSTQQVITICEVQNPPAPLPSGQSLLLVEFGPAGIIFSQPVTVTLPLPPGTSDFLDIVFYNPVIGTWTSDGISNVRVVRGPPDYVVFELTHFTVFAVVDRATNVPDVVGLTQAAAETAITNAGLAVGTVTTATSSTVPQGNVISQDPVADTSVDAGSAVNLVVSLGSGGGGGCMGGSTKGGGGPLSMLFGLLLCYMLAKSLERSMHRAKLYVPR